jgi:hypothetical protein
VPNVLDATVSAQGCADPSPRDGLPACRGKDVRRGGAVTSQARDDPAPGGTAPGEARDELSPADDASSDVRDDTRRGRALKAGTMAS